ncbi:DUF2057 domain-containing protein [Shewanella litorisediminis]|uniref:DUF2057 domain-containing protein n=1 Tax=Shewanella litorisediminis TaxID=1173586 RepID=A0ABX7G6Z4_9GAMM|nr:DUF2057 domain-containing protein [Shewanella litorisediminis]MCL2916850.1 DUF2057 domain-containing protein [Shewanella litorisediminis]QRH02982.1 DUF2057 domain-containing protein [Shewanella litorisediminis]
MKSVLPVGALLALAASSSVFAGSLTIPMSFEYLALDGQEISTNSFTHKAELDLSPGTHKIAIRYHDMVDDEFSDSQTFIKSAPFILTLRVDGDYDYFLKPANGDQIKQPKQFAKSPQVVVSRADKGEVSYKVVQTDYKEDSFVGRLFGGSKGVDIDEAAAAATAAGTVAVASTVPSAPVSPAAPVSPSAPVLVDSNVPAATSPVPPAVGGAHAQQMLQYWWLQADEKTRKEFMSWAIKQL